MSQGNSEYRRHPLILKEGKDVFHERVHFWQHVGTTFGAFQLLGYLITAKAMNKSFRRLASHNKLVLPFTKQVLTDIEDKDDKKAVELALRYKSLIGRYEINNFEELSSFRNDAHMFYAGRPPAPPMVICGPSIGLPLGGIAVTEIHNLCLAWLRCETVLVDSLQRHLIPILEKIPGDRIEIIAWLCDWSLMPPNPNMHNTKPGEIHPGWRFVLGLEHLLADGDHNSIPRDDYISFSTALSKSLEWMEPAAVLSQYDSFISLAAQGERNQTDAKRNRETYGAFRRFLEAARDIRISQPDAFALPHRYESMLFEALPPPVTMRNSRFHFSEPTVRDWFFRYLVVVSVVQQVFSESDIIKCAYRHFEIEDACRHMNSNASPNGLCYMYPAKPGICYKDCQFPQQLKTFGLELEK